MNRNWKLFLLGALLIPCWVIAIKYDIDLVVLHFAAELTHSDLSRVYAYNGNLGRYFYGPTSLVMIWPLGALSYTATKAIWIILQTLSYFTFWCLLSRFYPWLHKSTFAWIAIFIVSVNPIHNNYQSNNIQLMLMAVLMAAEAFRLQGTRRSEILAGILVVCAAAVKVFPAYVTVYYALQFRKNLLLGLLVGTAVCVGSPFLLFGLSNGEMLWRDFFANLFTYESENSLIKVPDILSLPSLLARTLGESSTAQLVSKAILALVAGGVLALGFRFRKSDPKAQLHTWALVLFAMAFVNPSTRPHYFIFYVPAYCTWIELIEESFSKAWQRGLVLLSVLLLAFTAEGVAGKTLNNLLERWSIPTWGMVLLGLGLFYAFRTLRHRPTLAAT